MIIIDWKCSVMTPYYSEETVYSKSDLDMENEDGISIKYYLRKIFPGSDTSKLHLFSIYNFFHKLIVV